MPWVTPSIQQLRALNRDNVTALLRSGPMIPNSVLRVMADSNSGLAFLVLLYIDWLANNLLPDNAEKEWLDRWANMFLTNSDGTIGRKAATYATGTISAAGIINTILPQGAVLTAQTATQTGGQQGVQMQTTQQVTIGAAPATVPVALITPGSVGNLAPGSIVSLATAVSGINGSQTVISLSGGTDIETDDELRVRVLARLQQPPMGGDAEDYVQWAESFPGVTRAWCSPMEMGIGTVTLRFMMDDLRATTNPLTNGFPLASDVAALQTYIDGKRPVTALDCFVEAPIPQPTSFTLANLDSDDASTLANIAASVTAMLATKAAPAFALNGVAQPASTIFAAWISDAVLNSIGVDSFDITMADQPPVSNGSLAVLGDILMA